LHVTIHYNGWGDYPNPQNYSTDRHLHAFFESAFVQKYARIEAVRALVKPSTPVQPAALLTQAQIASFVGAYLEETSRRVTPLYQIEAAHGFENGSPAAVAFVDDQLARGAAMLRDITVLAWQDSLNAPVGYPSVIVRDVLSGAAPAPAPAGSD